ncbi:MULTISPECIES: histidinol-phosphatase [Paenibacillus]|uniref:Histidinol-phosphatase n=1 Tax=Paenibacillus naphthalenovorans TaxID=162209 RepID=A0A0U2MYN3_9BACL|nr:MULTISPECIES: histidinol-phosphatase [Paenibacillus]ALS23439.1 phosphoesterase [Paenibacillus naphthalenovorans]NTZ17036.1 histidinol-phosphatase HisJ family protein [Paenibacillus sp. JMULE4]SDJ27337.1 histidinol-phosphatase (PHP family) [Paenibacillus naphthalenovorans]
MKFDLHTHHERCGHAVGTIRDYIEAGIARGLQVIGISDHSPYFASESDREQPGIAMAKSEFKRYVDEVLKLKEEYRGRIEVLLGVESDFFPEHADVYRKVYEQYPFDYIIGSVHLSGGVSIFNKKRWNGLTDRQKVEQKELYYDLIEQSARSGMFQILGHIDAMRGFYPAFSDIQTDAVDRTLKTIGEIGIAIEINTSGKTKDCGGWYPIDPILERALHYGVNVTFGSDAHVPGRVGDDWEEVAVRLKEIGFREWVYFKEKQMHKVPL